NVIGSAAAPFSAPNRLQMSAVFNSTVAYVLMPPVSNLQAETHRLRFKAFATTTGRNIDLGYFTDESDLNTFVLLESIPVPGTTQAIAEELFAFPAGIPTGVSRLVFRNLPSATGTSLIYIDDVIWQPIPDCLNPTFLSATNIQHNSAQLQWVSNAGEFEWDIKYGAPGFNPATEGTLVAGIFDNPYVLTGLAGATNYSYYVRAVCDSGSNNVSPWEGPFNFRTKCDLVTTFSENFDALTAGANTLANCWGRLGNTATNNVVTGSVAPMSPSNRYNIVSNFAAAPPTFGLAVMPGVSNLNAGTHRLRFTAFSTTANAQISIGYLTNPDDPGSFVVLSNLTLPGIVAANAQEIFYEVPNTVPAGVNYLAIRNQSAAGSVSVFFDNVAWEPIPSCPNPTALSTSGVTSTQATLAWSASVNNTSWEIEYGITGFTQGSGTIVSASTNPFVLTGLTPATTYQFYVRGVCAGPENSVWSQVGSFTTLCATETVIPYAQNFNSTAIGFIPLCWSTSLVSGTTNWLVGTTAQNGEVTSNNDGNFVHKVWTNSEALLISNAIDLSAYAAQNLKLTFKNHRRSPAHASDRVNWYINSQPNLTGATLLQSYPSLWTETSPATAYAPAVAAVAANGWYSYAMEFPGSIQTGSQVYLIAQGITAGGSASYALAFDDFLLDVVSTVPPVCATNVQATQPAGCGNFPITITWNPVSGADGYKITAGTTPGGTNLANAQNLGNVTSFVFNTPTINTTYYYTIVPFNGNGDATGCAEQSFTTATTGCYCVPSSAFTSDYISNFTTTGGATNITVSKAVISPTGYGNFSATQTVTQAAGANFNFSNTFVGGANGLRIWVDWNNDFNFDASESVFFLTNPDLVKTGSITIPVNAIPGNYRMRVRAQWGTGADPTACGSISFGEALDFTLTVTPPAACPAPSGITTTIASSTSLNINWTNIASATGGYEWRVMNNNDPVATGTPAASGNTASGVTTALATGLVTGNTYQVYVRSLCDASAISDWSGATNVSLSYCASVPASVDGQGITNIVLGATNFANTNASYTNHTATVVNVEQGENVNLQITFATGYAYATNVWIDFNNNLTFETSELVFQGTSTSANPTVFNASFTMPASAPLGNRRMRIGTADPDFGQVPPNPCYNGSWGVTLDFALNIQENLSLVELPTNQLTFYPNPVKDVLNLVNNTTIERVEIYNLLGQQVMHVRTNATQTSVQVGELAKGAYIVKAYADGAEHTFKIIKN
ncbi:MAG: fibronectin type III domain-containing protein, partial [Flavobacteriales bacterium]|nr:fibronectin type III domain-containing protein [Flavobacteriales bacterium]